MTCSFLELLRIKIQDQKNMPQIIQNSGSKNMPQTILRKEQLI